MPWQVNNIVTMVKIIKVEDALFHEMLQWLGFLVAPVQV